MTMADTSSPLESSSSSAGKGPNADKSNMSTSLSEERMNEKPTKASEKPSATRTSNGDDASKKPLSVDEARAELATWINKNNKPPLLSTDEASTLNVLLKEFDSQKEKVVKLKSLLGRSAKAQRESKVDLDATQKRLDHALREIDRLNKKIDKLANRPTHMELLADFETNFDRAMLSVATASHPHPHHHHQQPGGEDTGGSSGAAANAGAAGTSSSTPQPPLSSLMNQHHHESSQSMSSKAVDHLLLQELNDSKQRIEKLESLNAALLSRSSQLEGEGECFRFVFAIFWSTSSFYT
jgi:hypothetical protein